MSSSCSDFSDSIGDDIAYESDLSATDEDAESESDSCSCSSCWCSCEECCK